MFTFTNVMLSSSRKQSTTLFSMLLHRKFLFVKFSDRLPLTFMALLICAIDLFLIKLAI